MGQTLLESGTVYLSVFIVLRKQSVNNYYITLEASYTSVFLYMEDLNMHF